MWKREHCRSVPLRVSTAFYHSFQCERAGTQIASTLLLSLSRPTINTRSFSSVCQNVFNNSNFLCLPSVAECLTLSMTSFLDTFLEGAAERTQRRGLGFVFKRGFVSEIEGLNFVSYCREASLSNEHCCAALHFRFHSFQKISDALIIRFLWQSLAHCIKRSRSRRQENLVHTAASDYFTRWCCSRDVGSRFAFCLSSLKFDHDVWVVTNTLGFCLPGTSDKNVQSFGYWSRPSSSNSARSLCCVWTTIKQLHRKHIIWNY